jgi:hypothetical protein
MGYPARHHEFYRSEQQLLLLLLLLLHRDISNWRLRPTVGSLVGPSHANCRHGYHMQHVKTGIYDPPAQAPP